MFANMWVMNDDGVRGDMTSRYDAVRARMNSGELYVDQGEGLEALEAERTHGKELLYDFNHTRPGETAERLRLLRELLGAVGESVWIESPFLAAYGSHISIGERFYANFNLVIVDDADVHGRSSVPIPPPGSGGSLVSEIGRESGPAR